MLSTEYVRIWGKPSKFYNMLAGIYRLASCWPNPFLFLPGIGCVVLASLAVLLVRWLNSSLWNVNRPSGPHFCLYALSLCCNVPVEDAEAEMETGSLDSHVKAASLLGMPCWAVWWARGKFPPCQATETGVYLLDQLVSPWLLQSALYCVQESEDKEAKHP